VWEVTSGTELFAALQRHDGVVCSVTFSPDGTKIVSGSSDLTVRVWDAVSGTGTLSPRGHVESVSGLAFSPDGSRIVSGSLDNIRVWDTLSGSEAPL